MGELPEAVRESIIKPLVTLVGPQSLFDSVSSLLSQHNPDQPLDFAYADYNIDFRPRKELRSMEKYKPKGILRSDWAWKVRRVDPGAVVIMIDWSGRGPNSIPLEYLDWKTKEGIIFQEVRKIKEKSRGRSIKIGLFVLLTPNEDISIEEKVNYLKKNSDLSSKGIVLSKDLPENVNVSHLKKYLCDNVLTHYKDEIERYKKFKSKTVEEFSSPLLQIRYDFKLGFMSELRRDKDNSLNYYKKAYQHLRSFLSKDNIQSQEIKAVADCTSYRIFSILLSKPYKISKINEAITAFRIHINSFKELSTLMAFETLEWLTFNFIRFGELLEAVPIEFISPSNLWAHSGFYYFSAASYIKERMRITIQDGSFLESAINWKEFLMNAGLSVRSPNYLGHPEILAAHPLQGDVIEGITVNEQTRMIKTIQESDFSHVNSAMSLLFRAVHFYKNVVVMPRRVASLLYSISELHLNNGDLFQSCSIKSNILKCFDNWENIGNNLSDSIKSWPEATENEQQKAEWLLNNPACEPLPVAPLPVSEQAVPQEVVPPSPKITMVPDYSPSAYIGEEHVIKLSLVPSRPILFGKLIVIGDHTDIVPQGKASIDRDTTQQYKLSYTTPDNSEGQAYIDEIQVPELTDQPFQIDLRILFYEEGNYNFKLLLSYKARNQNGNEFFSESDIEIDLNVLSPFQANFKSIQRSRKGMIVASFWVHRYLSNHIFLNSFEIQPSNWNVKDALHELPPNYRISESNILSHSFAYELPFGVNELSGDFVINWNGRNEKLLKCRIPFKYALDNNPSFSLEVKVPCTGKYEQLIYMEVLVQNLTGSTINLAVSLLDGDEFLIGGPLQYKTDLVPAETSNFYYSLLPLKSGVISLPKIEVVNKEEKKKWEGRIQIQP